MKNRVGLSIIVIGVIHFLFGLAVFPGVWISMIQDGLINTVGEEPMRGAVVWFQLYAFPLIALGHTIASLEWEGNEIPGHLFWYLLMVLTTGVFLMPASGFWLLLIPLYGLWMQRNHVPHVSKAKKSRECS